MAERRLDQFKVQELASTAWAFMTVGQKDEQFFNVLAKMAERCLGQCNAQGFANTAWTLTDSAACALGSC